MFKKIMSFFKKPEAPKEEVPYKVETPVVAAPEVTWVVSTPEPALVSLPPVVEKPAVEKTRKPRKSGTKKKTKSN